MSRPSARQRQHKGSAQPSVLVLEDWCVGHGFWAHEEFQAVKYLMSRRTAIRTSSHCVLCAEISALSKTCLRNVYSAVTLAKGHSARFEATLPRSSSALIIFHMDSLHATGASSCKKRLRLNPAAGSRPSLRDITPRYFLLRMAFARFDFVLFSLKVVASTQNHRLARSKLCLRHITRCLGRCCSHVIVFMGEQVQGR